MEESKSQAESGGVRPSPALLWTKKSSRKPSGSDSSPRSLSLNLDQPQLEQDSSEPASVTKGRDVAKAPKVSPKATRTSPAKPLTFTPRHYVDLSTKPRKSVQLAIAELRHIRKKAGKPFTIKQFIEEALTACIDSPRARLDFVPESRGPEHDTDPLETFNNVIERELKNEIADICHERGKIGHPVSTLIAILDEAFAMWLPRQEDLPRCYLESVCKSHK